MNDSERELWVLNDESLYHDQRHSHLSMTAYIRSNRAELDAYIKSVLDKEPDK